MPAMTALQQAAWQAPFLTDDLQQLPPRIEEPRRGWRVGLSINL
jgi:hypothetical protein